MKVAFVGKMGDGKTTAANILVDQYGFTRLSFATPLKELTQHTINTFIEFFNEYDDQNRKEWSVKDVEYNKNQHTIRHLLQFIGTEVGREWLSDEDVWVRMLESKLDAIGDNVVIDDARFANELQMLVDRGFKIVHLARLPKNHKEELQAKYQKRHETLTGHKSETELYGFLEQLKDNKYKHLYEIKTRSILGVNEAIKMLLQTG